MLKCISHIKEKQGGNHSADQRCLEFQRQGEWLPSKAESDLGPITSESLGLCPGGGHTFFNDSDKPSVQPNLRTTDLEHAGRDTAKGWVICPEKPQGLKLRGPGRKESGVRMGLKQGTNLLGSLGMKQSTLEPSPSPGMTIQWPWRQAFLSQTLTKESSSKTKTKLQNPECSLERTQQLVWVLGLRKSFSFWHPCPPTLRWHLTAQSCRAVFQT